MHSYTPEERRLYGAIICYLSQHIDLGRIEDIESNLNYLPHLRIKLDYDEEDETLTIQGNSVFDSNHRGPSLTMTKQAR